MKQNLITGLLTALKSGGTRLACGIAAALLLAAGPACYADDIDAPEPEDDVDSEAQAAEYAEHSREFQHSCFILSFMCDSAYDYFKESCDQGYDDACVQLAWMYHNGIDVKKENIKISKDDGKAQQLLENSCSRYFAPACQELASLYHQKKNIGDAIRTLGKAIEEYEKECTNYKEGPSCTKLGHIYERKWLNIDKDVSSSLSYFTKGCELGDTEGCVEMAKLYQKGVAGDKGKKEAKKIFELACTNRYYAEACAYAADYYVNKMRVITGGAMFTDADMFSYYLNAACSVWKTTRYDPGLAEICYQSAALEYAKNQKGKDQCRPQLAPPLLAAQNLSYAVRLGNKDAENLQASIVKKIHTALEQYSGGTVGNSCDKDQYSKYMEEEITKITELCDEGVSGFRDYNSAHRTYGDYCMEAAYYHQRKNDQEQSEHFLDTACSLHQKEGCLTLAEYYKSKNNKEQVQSYFYSGCDNSPDTNETCKELDAFLRQ